MSIPNKIDTQIKMRNNIKYSLVEFIIAFLLGIAGLVVMFYIFMAMPFSSMYGDDKTGFFFALFTGVPLGSSLGILITKTFILRTDKFSVLSVLCLLTSLLFGYLAGRYLWLTIPDYIFELMGPGLSDTIVFPLVTLFALIGYRAMEAFMRGKTRDAPHFLENET